MRIIRPIFLALTLAAANDGLWASTVWVGHRARNLAPAGGNIGHVDGHSAWRDFSHMEMRYTYSPGKRDHYW